MSAGSPRRLTTDEVSAIETLRTLGSKWPKTLTLWCVGSGLMHVALKGKKGRPDTSIVAVHGIDNDGGDPTPQELIRWSQTRL